MFVSKKARSRYRFDSLLHIVDLEDRIIYSDADETTISDLINKPIDYNAVDKRLAGYRDKSLAWLRDALRKEKDVGKAYAQQDSIESWNAYYNILVARMSVQDDKINRLSSMIKALSYGKNLLPLSQTIDEYFNALKHNADHCIYIVAVKDTPGLAVSENMARKLQECLNITQDMVQKHWKSYIAIIDCGKIVFEQLSDEKIEEVITIEDFSIDVTSAALNVGNIAQILINGIDYAVNKRGFNIVAIDKVERRILDSAYIDMHLPNYEFAHK
ncbi:MAG: hypothetical protein LUD50_07475 [Clostridia bacterium]|nr:hypothetical protein [Clostridia bacterium]